MKILIRLVIPVVFSAMLCMILCITLIIAGGSFVESVFIAIIILFLISTALLYFLLDYLVYNEARKFRKILHLKHNNERLRMEQWVHPIKYFNRHIRYYVRHKETQLSQLKKIETFRKEFMANVSHELKTPIFSAQGFVHTLLEGAIEDKSVRIKFLKRAARNLDDLDVLVKDLLTISHMETGQVTMKVEPFDIKQVCESVIESININADNEFIKVGFEDNTIDDVMVMADAQRIHQVMVNLVSNAVKYSGNGASVQIGFRIHEKSVVVFVRDNGYGIPEESQERIFERFYRLDKSRSRNKGGTGLGLAIVKHIIEAHGSEIKLKSELKVGSEFSFELPKAMEYWHFDENERFSQEDEKMEPREDPHL